MKKALELAKRRPLLLEVFAAANLAFLVLDIWLAHSVNEFHHPAEWIPLVYAAVGSATLGLNLVLPGDPFGRDGRRGHGWWVGVVVGGLGVLVGVSGLVWHLESQFFEIRTLRSLVYSAPFVAPLAFAGVGFLVLLNRLTPHHDREWGEWVVFLSLGGFAGNFGLSLVDHAQNGFFEPAEWIPVVASALAVGYLVLVVTARVDRTYLRAGWLFMGLQVVIGMVGFVLHALPLLDRGPGPIFDAVVYGPPLFAPLLFANLALLAGLGLWDLREKTGEREMRSAPTS